MLFFLKCFLFTIFVLLCVRSVDAQGDAYAVNYTTKDGLATNEIFWILQAENGLLWLGCDDGLVSFDGVDFKSYTAPNARNKAMSALQMGKDGKLWCHNFANQIYYLEADSMHLLEPWDNYSKGKYAISQLKVKGDSVCIVSHATTYIYNTATKQITYIRGEVEKVNDRISFRYSNIGGVEYLEENKAPKQLVWKDKIYYDNKMGALKSHVNGFVRYQNQLYLLNSKYSRPDLMFRKESLFKTKERVPFLYVCKKDSVEAILFPPEIEKYGYHLHLNNIEFLSEHEWLLPTSEGVFLWNRQSNEVQHFLKGKYISDATIDHEQNIWATSTEEGIFFIPNRSVKTYPFILDKGTPYCMVKADDHYLMVGYGDGKLIYWDLEKEKAIFEHQFVLKNRVQHLTYDKEQGDFWVISAEKSFLFNPKTLKLRKFNYGLGAVKDLVFDSLNNIIVATGHGARIVSKRPVRAQAMLPNNWWLHQSVVDSLEGIAYYNFNPSTYVLLGPEVRTYAAEWSGMPDYTIWLAYNTGLSYFVDGSPWEIKALDGESIIAKTLEMNEGEDELWVGTLNKGVYLIKNKVIIQHITMEDGLPSNEIRKLYLHKDMLWMATAQGVARYDLKKNTITVFNQGTGLPTKDVQDFFFEEDKIFFLSNGHLMSMPLNAMPQQSQPLIELTQLIVNDSALVIRDGYKLQPHENNIKIGLRGILFKSQGDFYYRYRLKGVEKNWNTIDGNKPNANYPELGGGIYFFEAQIVGANGAVSEKATLQFLIKTPFYEQLWFKLGGLLLFLLSVLGLYRFQIQKLKRQNEAKLERSRLERDLRISELKAIKSQLNPHFIFNALNSIQDYIVTNEKWLASDYLGKFADLMRLYLQHSEAGQVALHEEMDALKLYLELEAIRLPGGLDFKMETTVANPYEVEIPTMLVQPYVENAIKHGLFYKKENRKLLISFQQQEKGIILATVRDNGIGREAAGIIKAQRATKYQSFATSANDSRLDLLNYGRTQKIQATIIDLEVEGEAVGTEVQIYIPIKKTFE